MGAPGSLRPGSKLDPPPGGPGLFRAPIHGYAVRQGFGRCGGVPAVLARAGHLELYCLPALRALAIGSGLRCRGGGEQ